MNQKGFISLAALVAITFSVAIVALAGWRVYSYTEDQPQPNDGQSESVEIKNDSLQNNKSDIIDQSSSSPDPANTEPNPSSNGSLVTPPADAPTSSDDDDEYEDESEDEYEPTEQRPEDEIED